MRNPLLLVLCVITAGEVIVTSVLSAEPTRENIDPVEKKRGLPRANQHDRSHWAFQPIRRPAFPRVKGDDWAAHPIDLFILAKLEARGLEPNPPATRRELIRRVYFDLIGLPPSPEQIEAFEQNKSPDAYEKLIDHLLSLPQYGERWARHWLDVVRYAQSNGYERDDEKPLAWRYRDYVIDSFNQDKPFDRFILEQLAGDELKDATFDSVIATGFYRLGVWDEEPDDKRMAVFDELDDIISTTGTAFMGLTLGCARCHDHKFDPISQTDYYQLLSFVRNIRPYQNSQFTLDAANYAPLAPPDRVKQWREGREALLKPLQEQFGALQKQAEKTKQETEGLRTKVKQLDEQLASLPNGQAKDQIQGQIEGFKDQIKSRQTEAKKAEEERTKLDAKISMVQNEPSPFEWALSIRESGSKPIATHILTRGNAGTPGAEVQPAFLTVLGETAPTQSPRPVDAKSTGLRLALAEWIASPENPLTARVMVNRMWQHLFGRGLVKTTGDFGRSGIAPTHPELLDWLAAEFRETGWSVKQMHKRILLSHAYQMSSRIGSTLAEAVDPGNELFWRHNLRRLEAEAGRDTVLSISGRLNLKMGGRGFFPHLGGELIAGASNPGEGWEVSGEEERSRRTIYTFIKRTMLAPVLENFDYSNTTSPLGERPVTTVAPQALMLLNDQFFQRQAVAFAARLTREAGHEPDKQIRRAYRLAVGREPNERETQIAVDYLKRQTAAFAAIRSRLTFRPDVPESLNEGYLGRLQPNDMIIGPRVNWSYHQGLWGGGYSGIKTIERTRGPFALWKGGRTSDGIIHARVTLHKASQLAGLIFRGQVNGQALHGYDVILDQRFQRLVLQRHTTNATTLAEANASIRVERSYPLKIEAIGPRIRVWWNDGAEPILNVTDSDPLIQPGSIGVRTWGAAVSLDDLRLQIGDRTVDCAAAAHEASGTPGTTGTGFDDLPACRALESFCLLVLNLNEVIYVD